MPYRNVVRWVRGVAAGAAVVGVTSAAEPELPAEQVEFFEAKIRPILVERCYDCHSAAAGKSKGGLRLDTRDTLRKGGETGPAIVPGDPGKSLLLEAVRHASEDLQMPPKEQGGKLPPEEVALLEQWVRMGAPDPRTRGPAHPLDMVAARRHWAFQPVVKPVPPSVRRPEAIATPVDAFVVSALEARGLALAREAGPRTLLRRVAYDLTGLPPTMDEVEAFARRYPQDPRAYAEAVERLLASPAYGERWGRFWLDVARYADTQGYLVGNAERRFAFSHTYRDYVIRSFNDDKPYDQFVVEQLAADRLPLGEDKSPLAALGFLTLGRRFLGNQNDIIDDRIDVMTRGLLGLTVTCARCHDHKYDPVPTQDYYSLHGVFASSEEPAEKPLLRPLVDSPAYQQFLRKRAVVEGRIREKERGEVQAFLAGLRRRTGDYLWGAWEAGDAVAGEKFELFAGTRKLNPEVLRRWRSYLAEATRRDHPILAPWFALAALPAEGFREAAAGLIAGWRGDRRFHAAVVGALAGRENPPGSLSEVAGVYNEVFAAAEPAGTAPAGKQKGKSGRIALAPEEAEGLRGFLTAAGAPPAVAEEAAATMIRRQLNDRTAALRRELESLQWTEAGAPLRAMALVDRAEPRNSAVLLRGRPGNRGPEVPRRFLEVLSGEERVPFTDGSGRLELARAIASPGNPLTARVFVNRIWGWHFGRGLVDTPSDFGVRTPPPEHRALLDWLAASFMAGGWSTKALHRTIVLSRVYRQASDVEPAGAGLDPDNRWLARFGRRRLEFEAQRDTWLQVAGELNRAGGGLPDDLLQQPFTRRRTVYGFIDRQNLPGMFRTFDFPNPDVSSAQRLATTVPQQALFLLNSPFVLEMTRRLAARVEREAGASESVRIESLFRTVLQRPPDAGEAALARAFLDGVGSSGTGLTRWEALAQTLLQSNELAFLE
ncbi:MAG: PSD1 domain-containing protein [Verrucomicrobia bacterium]|nr:PSD1 domain-containing protein [Verrucomicrobiota bacterium]